MPKIDALSRRPDDADARGASTSPRASCSAASPASSGCARSWRSAGHTLIVTSDKDGPDSGLRARAARRRRRHLAAVLARLPDRRADRQGAEAEARDHRRHRLRPRRPRGGDRARSHRRRGHLLQQHQRLRARGDDDPRRWSATTSPPTSWSSRAAGTSPTASRAPTTSRACRSAPWPPAASASAVLRRLKPFDVEPALHRPPPAARGGRAGARRDLPRDAEPTGAASATW